MTPTPLDKIGLRWRDHKSAIWWLGLIYRRPDRFERILGKLSTTSSKKFVLILASHSFAYLFFAYVLGWFTTFNLLGFSSSELLTTSIHTPAHYSAYNYVVIAVVIFELIGGIAFGIASGFTYKIVLLLNRAIATNTILIINTIIVLCVAYLILVLTAEYVIAGSITLGIVISLVGIGLPAGIFLGVLGAIVIWNTLGITAALIFFITVITFFLRMYYSVWHAILLLSAKKIPGKWYFYHPIAWDDVCSVPFVGLDEFLVAYCEYSPKKGAREIERLILRYPSQQKIALRAKIIWTARQASKLKNLTQLEAFIPQLPEIKKGFFAETFQLREMLSEIIGIQMRLNTVNRPVLREPIAQMLRERIENFRHQIGGFHEPLASEFRQAATHWLEIAQKQVQEAQAILTKEPSPVVFRAGDPVNREQEAFVPRYGVVGDLDKQIMLSTGCPGLVLYGRRRMGKSTILGNLNGFLPETVIPVFISMQDPQAFTSLADWMRHFVQKTFVALALPSTIGVVADLPGFMRVLVDYNAHLRANGKRMLLAIDEYENIDRKLGEKIFPEDLLATIRESIQTLRNITWIFAGSHDITELQHAEWPSYLVSARTIEVPLFTSAETRLLLTEPMKFSPLWPKDDPKRPRFAPEFWGENGIERIHHEAGGWPHLVQLIAETIVDLINDETKRQVDAELFERSLNKAIVSGHNVLYQLMRGESTLPGEWEYLAAFRKRETQPLPEDEAIYISLRRRLLVEEENGQWRLRVPLMARWLRERG